MTGCPPEVLNDVAGLETCFRNCAVEGGATLVSSHFHHFSPQGVSGVVVIAESHVTVHTWPEHGYAALDVFTCGSRFQHEVFVGIMQAGLRATQAEMKTLPRGQTSGPPPTH